MINCYKFKNLISNYIDKEINFHNRKFFEEHLKSCPSCEKLYNQIVDTKNTMLNLPEISVRENFLPKLRNKILTHRNAKIQATQKKYFSFNRIPSFAYGFSAALLAVVVGFIIIQSQKYNTPIPANMPVTEQKAIPSQPAPQQNISPGKMQEQLVTMQKEEQIQDSTKSKIDQNQNDQQNPSKNFQSRIKTVSDKH